MGFLYIDTETTGVDPTKNEIIELAARYEDIDGTLQRQYFNVYSIHKSDLIVDVGALKVNNRRFNESKIASECVSKSTSLKLFVDWYLSLPTTPEAIIGHRIDFDLNFLKEEYLRLNIDISRLFTIPKIDTYPIAYFLRQAGLIKTESISLVNLAKEFGIYSDDAHTAMGDAIMTSEVYRAMLERLKGK